jgi:hypothetical protein
MVNKHLQYRRNQQNYKDIRDVNLLFCLLYILYMFRKLNMLNIGRHKVDIQHFRLHNIHQYIHKYLIQILLSENNLYILMNNFHMSNICSHNRHILILLFHIGRLGMGKMEDLILYLLHNRYNHHNCYIQHSYLYIHNREDHHLHTIQMGMGKLDKDLWLLNMMYIRIQKYKLNMYSHMENRCGQHFYNIHQHKNMLVHFLCFRHKIHN